MNGSILTCNQLGGVQKATAVRLKTTLLCQTPSNAIRTEIGLSCRPSDIQSETTHHGPVGHVKMLILAELETENLEAMASRGQRWPPT